MNATTLREGNNMDELTIEATQSLATQCPFHTPHSSITIEPDTELVLLKPKRVMTQYVTNDAGEVEFHFDYGDKEIVFDDPALHAFGETLARQSRFVAQSAVTWGKGFEEGILAHARAVEPRPIGDNGARPSPLPPAHSSVPRTWFECEAVTQELTGRAIELGYLELVVPVYRVAHIALDAEGRQVGEANVFPSQLRLDVPTQWRTCRQPLSRRAPDECHRAQDHARALGADDGGAASGSQSLFAPLPRSA
jgi:hypothetical protein